MTIDDLKGKIRPDIEAMFGAMMTNLMFTNATLKVTSECQGMGEDERCKKFLEFIGSDDKFVGMLGSAGAQSKVSSWKALLR